MSGCAEPDAAGERDGAIAPGWCGPAPHAPCPEISFSNQGHRIPAAWACIDRSDQVSLHASRVEPRYGVRWSPVEPYKVLIVRVEATLQGGLRESAWIHPADSDSYLLNSEGDLSELRVSWWLLTWDDGLPGHVTEVRVIDQNGTKFLMQIEGVPGGPVPILTAPTGRTWSKEDQFEITLKERSFGQQYGGWSPGEIGQACDLTQPGFAAPR